MPRMLANPGGVYFRTIGIVVNTSPKPPELISDTAFPSFRARNPMNMNMMIPNMKDAVALAIVTTVALNTMGAFLGRSEP
jgi:hypothetical protein